MNVLERLRRKTIWQGWRLALRAGTLLGSSVILLACATGASAAESRGWGSFFPFGDGASGNGASGNGASGNGADEPAAEETSPYPSTGAEEPGKLEPQSGAPWMFTSPLANVTWPQIKMPKIDFRPPWGGNKTGGGEGMGQWMRTPFTKAKTATRGAVDRTRTAWNSTLDKMKMAMPDGSNADSAKPPLAVAPSGEPGFWQQWFGGDPSAEPDSVVEMMAQERLDP